MIQQSGAEWHIFDARTLFLMKIIRHKSSDLNSFWKVPPEIRVN